MKKIILGVCLTAASLFMAVSTFAAYGAPASFSLIQFSVWPGVDNWPNAESVDGLRLGIYNHSEEGFGYPLNGVDLGILSGSSDVNGVQLSVANLGGSNIDGVQLAWLNMNENGGSLQLGAYNILKSSEGVQFGLANLNDRNNWAAQFAVINYTDPKSSGFQVGAINAADRYDGFQLGLLNINSDNSKNKGFQIGLINWMDNGFLPLFPFFNFSK